MKHYLIEDLEQYRNHEMSLLKRALCRFHVSHCFECSSLIKELEEQDQLTEQIQQALNDLERADKS